MKWSDHPVAHLRKVAIAYKKELAIGAVSKMSKSDLIVLLDKHLTLGEDGKIIVKSSPSKTLDVKIEEPKEKSKPSMKKEKELTEKESKAVEKKEKIEELESKLRDYKDVYIEETFYIGSGSRIPIAKRKASQASFKLYYKIKDELEKLTGKKYPELQTLSEMQKEKKNKKEQKKKDEKDAIAERNKPKEEMKNQDYTFMPSYKKKIKSPLLI